MRRDEQLDDMERTISRLRMDNDAMQEEIKNWRGERDQLRQAIEDARTQLASTGCPLCTYIDGKVTKSCALHTEVSRLNLQIDAWKRYHALLSEELDSAVGMAYLHGWKSTPEKIERGRKLRLELGIADSGMDTYAGDPFIEKPKSVTMCSSCGMAFQPNGTLLCRECAGVTEKRKCRCPNYISTSDGKCNACGLDV